MFAAGHLASNLVGQFREKDYGRWFEYKRNDSPSYPEAPHLIFVGPEGDMLRFAKVMKTVAYVAVDEDENGLVYEKWSIKSHKEYAQ